MMMSKQISRAGLYVLALVFASTTLGIISSPLARAQDKCKVELAAAEKKYQDGFFDEAIDLLLRCLDKDRLTVEEQEQAYKLLARAYYAKRLLDKSEEALRKLLKLLPNWKPNPETETPPFQKLTEEVIKEVEQERQEKAALSETPPTKKGSGKKWLFIGGGTALAAGGAFFLFSNKDSGTTPPASESGFPKPPVRPDGN